MRFDGSPSYVATPDLRVAVDAAITLEPLYGALLKNEQDVHLFERLALLARREALSR